MKHALLIGINYVGTPNELRGCVNDVKTRAKTLIKKHGFETENVVMLTDAEATTEKIITAMSEMKKKLQPGDLMYLLYSGHGTQVPDPSPDKHEVDGLAEAICPVDFDWSREHMLIDDDLNSFLSDFPDLCQFVASFDSCHSGDGLRDMAKPPVGKNVVFKEKFITPLKPVVADVPIRSFISAEANRKGILIAGCHSNQTSADAVIGKKPCGAFSYCVEKVLATAKHDITYRRLVTSVAASLRFRGFTQVPELDCTKADVDRKFLS